MCLKERKYIFFKIIFGIQLFFRIFKAEKLPKMDTFGTIDAFISTNFFNQTLKTNVVNGKDNKGDLTVQWDEEILLPI